MQHLTNIAVHNFGPNGSNPLSKSGNLTEVDINNAHKLRWPDFPSEMTGSFIGYNVIIWPDGSWKQFRFLGEETAAQKGHNFDTFSICLAGNFTKGVEAPTIEQKMRLKSLIRGLITGNVSNVGIMVKDGTTYSFEQNRIYPHRILQPNHTSCYGDSLSDTWARDLLSTDDDRLNLLKTLLELYKKMLQLLQQKNVGTSEVNCLSSDARG